MMDDNVVSFSARPLAKNLPQKEEGIDVVDWKNEQCFEELRFNTGYGIPNKAGAIPFYKDNLSAELKFLFVKPAPKRNAKDDIPFAPARGTRLMKKEGGQWQDVPDEMDTAEAIQDNIAAERTITHFETPAKNALREAEEELGLQKRNVRKLFNCGTLRYDSERKGTYPIHFYAAEVQNPDDLIGPERLDDAVDVQWKTAEEVQSMIDDGSFNKGYQPIFEAISQRVQQHVQNPQIQR